MIVIKRDGRKVKFDKNKIINAIMEAYHDVNGASNPDDCETMLDEEEFRLKAVAIADHISSRKSDMTVEEIQDMVEEKLMATNRKDVARAYINYRQLHKLARNNYESLMNVVREKLFASNVVNQNANVDERSFGGRKGEMGNAVAKEFALAYCMSPMARSNHENNEIYIHDLDSYAVGMHNCLTVPLDDLLTNGFNARQTSVRPAQSVSTAMQLIAVIFQIQSLQQFGGVSASHIDHTMVPYVRKSFYKHYKDGARWLVGKQIDIWGISDQEPIDSDFYKYTWPNVYGYALEMTERETRQAAEGMFHNLKFGHYSSNAVVNLA